MKMDGEDKMLNVLKKLGYERPYESLNDILEELYQNGEFLYIMKPLRLDPSSEKWIHTQPVWYRLSRN